MSIPMNGDIVDDKVYNALVKSNLKPLYMLIKVEVDKDYITNQQSADEFAEDFGVVNECVIMDTYYPDDEQYPYIAK
tara:strand:- start:198 stop:428 length:231 start_codon:yes stop_codon:yes gene_type:complete